MLAKAPLSANLNLGTQGPSLKSPDSSNKANQQRPQIIALDAPACVTGRGMLRRRRLRYQQRPLQAAQESGRCTLEPVEF